MLIELGIAAGFLTAKYIYEGFTQPKRKIKKLTEIEIPRTDAGAPLPKIYGRCRVRQPILTWLGPVSFEEDSISGIVVRHVLRANMFYVLGEGFPHGDGITAPIAS